MSSATVPGMGALATTFSIMTVNGLVLAALILGLRENRAANRALAALVGFFSLRLCVYALGFAGAYDGRPWLTFAPLDMSASFGPLAYLYVVALTGRLPSRWGWHLAPAVAQLVYQAVCFVLPLPMKWAWYSGGHLDHVEPVATTLILAQCCGYALAAWRRYVAYQSWLDDQFGNREQWRLGWLRTMLVAFAAATAATLVAVVWNFAIAPLDYFSRVPVMLGFALLAYVLGLLGWRHGSTLYPRRSPPEAQDVDVVGEVDADRGSAGRADYLALVEDWRHRVELAGWWREERLTAADLASRLHVSERTLSRGLREGGGMNFNTFVNTFRVAEVQRAIRGGSADDLLDLALASGFASKASFNRAFRTIAGETPSAWRRAAHNSPIDTPAAI